MTNPALKALLKPLGISRSGDKQALIAKLAKERDYVLHEWLPNALQCAARDFAAKSAGKTSARCAAAFPLVALESICRNY